jgi:hypothetical protein
MAERFNAQAPRHPDGTTLKRQGMEVSRHQNIKPVGIRQKRNAQTLSADIQAG